MYHPSIELLINNAFNVFQRLQRSPSKRDREDAKRLRDAVLKVIAARTPEADA